MEEKTISIEDYEVRYDDVVGVKTLSLDSYRLAYLRDIGVERLIDPARTKPNYGSFYYQYDNPSEKEIEPEFDFKKVFLFYHNEPLIERALIKRLDLMFKAGWKLMGSKPKVTSYVQKRLTEICIASEVTLDLLLRDLMLNLYKYSNVFIYMERDRKKSSGKSRRLKLRPKEKKEVVDPVASFTLLSPLVMKPSINREGKIIKWTQYDVESGRKILRRYKPTDIVHLAINKETGFIWGKPMILSVVPDVEALRRMEENVQMLLAHHIFPLYQYMVGTEERPAVNFPDGTSEVDYVKRLVQSLPTQGVVFTPERHKIEVVSDSKALDASEYLRYFKDRVYLGLGVASVDMGEAGTSNRGTAITISQNLKDSIQADQKVFSELFNLHIIRPILMESKMTIDLAEAFNSVGLGLLTIDADEKIKRENHALTLYTGGIVSQTEAREMSGHDPMDEDTKVRETFPGFQTQLQAYLTMLNAKLQPTKTAEGAVKPPTIPAEQEAVFRKALTSIRPENSGGSKLDPKKTTNSQESETAE